MQVGTNGLTAGSQNMNTIKKNFIITIDAEEDNQWNVEAASSTENAKYLLRFQELCNRFEFKPVYLTTYHMAGNSYFAEFAKEELKHGNCEIGMHLHAWCSPPEYALKGAMKNRAYLIEYPLTVMEEKIKRLTDILEKTFGRKIVSHRAGRWVLNQDYVDLLSRYGYLCDCSVTPGVNWSSHVGEIGTPGSDYRDLPANPFLIADGVLEVPVSIRNVHYFDASAIHSPKGLLRECYHLVKGKQSWLRPSNSSLCQMKKVVDLIHDEDTDYVMFMIHSSELMPGGSPYYPTEDAVERVYSVLEELFEYTAKSYRGITLEEYCTNHKHAYHNKEIIKPCL